MKHATHTTGLGLFLLLALLPIIAFVADTKIASAAVTSPITISGTLYADEGITPITTTETIKLAVTSASTTPVIYQTTATNGVYQFTNMVVPIGAPLSLWVSGDATTRAFVITKASSNANITGLDLYQNHVIMRHEASSGTFVSIPDLALYDNDNNADIQFTANGGSLSIFKNQELYIWPGKVFAAGGPVTVFGNASSSTTDGSIHIAQNATLYAVTSITLGGNWTADAGAKFIANSSSIVTFNATTSDKTISGVLAGSSAFYKVVFNGVGGTWVITDPMKVSAPNALDTFVIKNGTVRLGDGNGDNLEVDGKMVIAGNAGEVGTFKSAPIPQGSQITIDVNNNAAPVSCANCVVSVGATSGNGQGVFKIDKNTLLRLNPSSASDTGIEVESTGYLKIKGEEMASTTFQSITQNTSNSTFSIVGSQWTNGQFNGMVARVSNTDSLAFGQIYDILSTTPSSITVSATTTATDSNPTVVGGTCSGSAVCIINPSLSTLIAAPTGQVGRYIHNITDNKYYLIATSSNANPDVIGVVNNSPDDFTTMTSGKAIEITDGIRAGDSFQVLDYAAVTAGSGLNCTSPINGAFGAYILGKAGSENLVQYADVCNMGKSAQDRYGLTFNGLDGRNQDEGATVEYSRIRKNMRGVSFINTSNMNGTKGIRYNLIQNPQDTGITVDGGSNNDVSYNRVSGSTGTGGVYVRNGSNGNTITGDISYQSTGSGITIENSKDNHLDSNVTFLNKFAPGGVYLNNSSDIQVNNLTSFGNGVDQQVVGFGMLVSGGINNTVASSSFFTNTRSGLVVSDSPGNGVMNNRSFANGYHGMTQVCSSISYPVVLFGNNYYSNSKVGLQLESGANCTAYVINDHYGVLGDDAAAELGSGKAGAPIPGAHRFVLYNSSLGGHREMSLDGLAPATDQTYYIISRKHNGISGATKIWGHYVTASSDNPETPQNESADLYTYGNNLWEKTVTRHVYNGAGTEATDLHYNISSADLSNGPYFYRLFEIGTSCPTNCQFQVWRNGVLVGAANAGQQYIDSNGVGFTVDNGATPYTPGDTYTFAMWDASGDANTQKSISMNLPYPTGTSTYTVSPNARLELKGGASGNPTLVTRGGTSGGYQFNILGTLDANGYSFNYGGDTGLSSLLNISSGANVVSLDNGSFDNFARASGSANSFVAVDSSLIGTGTPSKSISGLSFANSTGIANCNVNVVGSLVSGYWDVASSTGTFSGMAFSCVNGGVMNPPGQLTWMP